jgi:polygalacturonase
VGDGVTDDTDAFLAAIRAIRNGVLYIPAGQYIITQKLEIAKRIVLRGEMESRLWLWL